MKKISFVTALLLICALTAFAQQQNVQDPEELAKQEKKLSEFIDGEVQKLERTLKLDDWQVFYVDSILNNDYHALQAELSTMGQAKVSNSDIYLQVRDKWSEQMFSSLRKVFNDEQWAKFLKNGAGKEKKARDKRASRIAAAGGKTEGK